MKYKSLSKRYRDQNPREVFAHFPYKGNAEETWEEPFKRLARMAKDEDWSFHRQEFINQNQNYPILTNYLNYTFLRLQEEDKVKLSIDDDKACFNTGLLTPRGKDVYATFFRNKQAEERNQPDWTLYAFVDS